MTSNILYTSHFSELELTESATARKYGIDNWPTPEVVENLRQLCTHTLEPLREALGLPIIITSGYRCKELNEILVHAARRSQHIAGQAADFYVAQGPVQGSRVQGSRELLIQAFRLIITEPEIDFDQLIIYPTFIHVSYVSREKNRHQLTRASSNGAYTALSRADALALS